MHITLCTRVQKFVSPQIKSFDAHTFNITRHSSSTNGMHSTTSSSIALWCWTASTTTSTNWKIRLHYPFPFLSAFFYFHTSLHVVYIVSWFPFRICCHITSTMLDSNCSLRHLFLNKQTHHRSYDVPIDSSDRHAPMQWNIHHHHHQD